MPHRQWGETLISMENREYFLREHACAGRVPEKTLSNSRSVFHDLRNTFITHMDEAGIPKKVTDAVTGQSYGSMREHYSKVRIGRKLEAIQELDGYRASVRQALGKKTSTI
jgi:integrase